MKKTIYSLLLAAVCSYSAAHGQTTLASWSLTSNSNGAAPGNTVQASKLTNGNGITTPSFNSDGAASYAWEASVQASSEDYFEVCISPKQNFTLDVTGLSYTESRSSDGIRAYDLRWSKDGFKATSNLLLSVNVPDDENFRPQTLSSLGISVCKGETLCFRWYGYQSEDHIGLWRLRDISIAGEALPLCPNPNPIQQTTAFTLSNVSDNAMDVSWNRGNGTGVVVLARAGAAPEASLCGWPAIAASPFFGLGTNLGNGTYVVYDGTGTGFTLVGLAQGTRYYLEAYEYYSPGYCLIRSPITGQEPKANALTACSSQPDPIGSLRFSPTDQAMYLSWALPPCYDQVMVVCSTQPIAAVPTSADPSVYSADAVYGAGSDSHGDFVSPAYPIYRGTTGSAGRAEGLANGQIYYFRIFTFRSGQWVAGAQISVKPVEGCADLGDGGRVFINEIHYRNMMEDVDEGFELVGPTGTDLANYVLAVYKVNGFTDKVVNLSGLIGNEGQGYGAVWVPVADVFDEGGIALYNLVAGVVVEFLCFRSNPFTAKDGLADGLTAVPIGIREDPFTPLNFSLQRVGPGNCPGGMTWQGPMPASRGLINIGQAVLPIQLAYFEGRLIGDRVRLDWGTVSEEENDFMAVEHSVDGRSFREIGRVKGAGTTALPQSYELWHDQPLPGINYYRLRQVDFDGQFEYFRAIAIEYRPGSAVFKVYPTIAAERIVVELSTPRQSPGELVLFNLFGQPLQRLAVPEGGLRREISVEALPSGHYLLQWQPEAGERLVQRFVKQ